jgi:alkylation response protein AidB-like acyl-CoA dehydrogenase
MAYRAPVDDILFTLKTVVREPRLGEGIYTHLDEATVRAVVEEAGRFASEVLAPLNHKGDRTASRLEGGRVVTPPGWKEAYDAFVAAGWAALLAPEDYGGQALPEIVGSAVSEIWNAANLAFGLCPLLTQSAIHALQVDGSDELKALYLPRMVSGQWTGTMNLTEPQAGSDLGALTTRALPAGDGTYRLFGTKIFITYGEHELTENIVHMVLARLPDAPPGTRGISLFLVPKRLVGPDGAPGARNDVVCAGLEHKLGIHASPTCVMRYGEQDGAVGYLVGREHHGLRTMFIMMNAARLAVGVQGVALAERATQHAMAYAMERRQGRTHANKDGAMSRIAEHPDVRRMLATMRATTMAARAICLATAHALDRSHLEADHDTRRDAAHLAALLTPVAKAYATDVACEAASLGIQVHGGMGFVEETGAAQFYRDARILPIYEGTNGIQAIDLVTRKLPLEEGEVATRYIGELAATAAEVGAANHAAFGLMGERLAAAVDALRDATRWMQRALAEHHEDALAGATPYLRLFGLAAGGVYLARGALACVSEGAADSPQVALARFFAEQIAVAAPGLATAVTSGGAALFSIEPERLCT